MARCGKVWPFPAGSPGLDPCHQHRSLGTQLSSAHRCGSGNRPRSALQAPASPMNVKIFNENRRGNSSQRHKGAEALTGTPEPSSLAPALATAQGSRARRPCTRHTWGGPVGLRGKQRVGTLRKDVAWPSSQARHWQCQAQGWKDAMGNIRHSSGTCGPKEPDAGETWPCGPKGGQATWTRRPQWGLLARGRGQALRPESPSQPAWLALWGSGGTEGPRRRAAIVAAGMLTHHAGHRPRDAHAWPEAASSAQRGRGEQPGSRRKRTPTQPFLTATSSLLLTSQSWAGRKAFAWWNSGPSLSLAWAGGQTCGAAPRARGPSRSAPAPRRTKPLGLQSQG